MQGKLLLLALWALAIGPLLGAGSCSVKQTERLPPEEVRPLATASLDELLAKLENQAAAVETLNAETELRPTAGSAYSGVIEQYHDVKAFILAVRGSAAEGAPDRRIRVIGQAPIVRKNVFDMAATEEEFRIYLPTRNKFIVGPTELEQRSEKPIENLRPQHLFEALFPAAPRAEGVHLREENEWGGTRYYGVSELLRKDGRPVLHRRWWFGRSRLELVRMQRFDATGRLLADVHYSRWTSVDGAAYPFRIELKRPHDDYRLTIVVKKVTLNDPLEAEKFQLERPRGAELVELERQPAPAPAPARSESPEGLRR